MQATSANPSFFEYLQAISIDPSLSVNDTDLCENAINTTKKHKRGLNKISQSTIAKCQKVQNLQAATRENQTIIGTSIFKPLNSGINSSLPHSLNALNATPDLQQSETNTKQHEHSGINSSLPHSLNALNATPCLQQSETNTKQHEHSASPNFNPSDEQRNPAPQELGDKDKTAYLQSPEECAAENTAKSASEVVVPLLFDNKATPSIQCQNNLIAECHLQLSIAQAQSGYFLYAIEEVRRAFLLAPAFEIQIKLHAQRIEIEKAIRLLPALPGNICYSGINSSMPLSFNALNATPGLQRAETNTKQHEHSASPNFNPSDERRNPAPQELRDKDKTAYRQSPKEYVAENTAKSASGDVFPLLSGEKARPMQCDHNLIAERHLQLVKKHAKNRHFSQSLIELQRAFLLEPSLEIIVKLYAELAEVEEVQMLNYLLPKNICDINAERHLQHAKLHAEHGRFSDSLIELQRAFSLALSSEIKVKLNVEKAVVEEVQKLIQETALQKNINYLTAEYHLHLAKIHAEHSCYSVSLAELHIAHLLNLLNPSIEMKAQLYLQRAVVEQLQYNFAITIMAAEAGLDLNPSKELKDQLLLQIKQARERIDFAMKKQSHNVQDLCPARANLNPQFTNASHPSIAGHSPLNQHLPRYGHLQKEALQAVQTDPNSAVLASEKLQDQILQIKQTLKKIDFSMNTQSHNVQDLCPATAKLNPQFTKTKKALQAMQSDTEVLKVEILQICRILIERAKKKMGHSIQEDLQNEALQATATQADTNSASVLTSEQPHISGTRNVLNNSETLHDCSETNSMAIQTNVKRVSSNKIKRKAIVRPHTSVSEDETEASDILAKLGLVLKQKTPRLGCSF